MRWLDKTWLRLRALARKPKLDRELDDELRFHLENMIEEKVAAGMTPDAARAAALRDFGGVAQVSEECRDARGVTLAHDLVADLRYGGRMIRKHPGLSAVIIVTLALGIGATTAIFSFIDAILLRTLPVRDPGGLVVLDWQARREPDLFRIWTAGDCASPAPGAPGSSGCSLSLPFFRELAAERGLFAGTAAFANAPPLLVSGRGAPRVARGQLVSGDFFATLGVRAALGRVLEAGDEAGAQPVAVLSHAAWRRDFGADPSVVGRTIRLNRVAVTIVGVAEPGFTHLTPGNVYDLWLPLSLRRQLAAAWDPSDEEAGVWWLTVVGRLDPAVPAAQAEARASLLFRQAVVGNQLTEGDEPALRLVPATEGLTGSRGDYARQLAAMMIAVALVLAIACANVAGLLLARAAARRREMAVRLAMGAGRGRILRQLLTEALLLATLGGALGAALAAFGVDAMVAFFANQQARGFGFDVAVNARVLAFTAAVSVAVGVLFGLAPALRATRVDLASSLKRTDEPPRRRFGLGRAMVVAQVALSIIVLAGAGLFVRTLGKLRGVDPGFRTENVLLFAIDPTLAGYPKARATALYRDLQRELEALPGVTAASWSDVAPLGGGLWRGTVRFAGSPDPIGVDIVGVGPGFFATLKQPIVSGGLPVRDAQAVVNEQLARRLHGPIGARFARGDDGSGPSFEVVGVARDARVQDLRRAIEPTIYVPSQNAGVTFALRTASEPELLIPAVRALVARLAPDLALVDVRSEAAQIDQLLFRERLMARLTSMFALLALLLACVGLYALLSHEVARRTREVGVRMALGAQRRDVRRLVLRQGLALALAGVVLGVAGALAVTRFLHGLLFGVAPNDPLALGGASALLLAVAAAACLIPARRATRVDPMVALRAE